MGGGGGKERKEDGGGGDSGKLYNFVMLGGGGVGKSAVVIQFIQDKFVKDYDPTIEDSYRKQVVVDGKAVMLNIWDTAGQEEYEALQDTFIKDSHGHFIMYSTTDKRSFDQVRKYYRKIEMIKETKDEPVIILGNKADLTEFREVTTREGQLLAQELGCGFLETSAKTRVNVEKSFEEMVRKIRQRKKK